MPTQTENWTYLEFHAFVMLYAANADGVISPEERNLIMSNTLSAEMYDRIKSVFMANDDAQTLDIILSYRDKYCRTQADKDKILLDMVEIYNANDAFSKIEQGVHQLFKRML